MVTLHTSISNHPDDLARVRDMVSQLEHRCNLPAEVVFDVNVVLDEVLSNIFKYAYSDTARHEIGVRLSASDVLIEIAIEDDGDAFDPSGQRTPDLSQPLAERPEGGLGLHFVRNLMDEVRYKREKNRNSLILKKNFNATN